MSTLPVLLEDDKTSGAQMEKAVGTALENRGEKKKSVQGKREIGVRNDAGSSPSPSC